jgi:hypothetical protein
MFFLHQGVRARQEAIPWYMSTPDLLASLLHDCQTPQACGHERGRAGMKVGPIAAEDDGWWCQVVGNSGRIWTIRVRIVTVAGIDLYECWVNDVLLPTYRRREPSTEQTCLKSVFAAGMQYIEGHNPAP